MEDDDEVWGCPQCGWSGGFGDLDMAEDGDGDATGFECPSCHSEDVAELS